MRGAYESFPLGLGFGHRALLRNLDRFVEIADRFVEIAGRKEVSAPELLGEFVALYVTFLELHHLGEEEFIFPALRRHSAAKTTDVAHLDRWSSEHREICATGRALDTTAGRLRSSPGKTSLSFVV